MGKFTNKVKDDGVARAHWNHFTDEQKEKIRKNYPERESFDLAFDRAVNEMHKGYCFRFRVALLDAWISEHFWRTLKESWRSW